MPPTNAARRRIYWGCEHLRLNLGKLLLAALACMAAARAVAAEDRQAVVATVGGDPIRAGEVARRVAKATRGKKPDADALRFLQAESLEEIIAWRLVLAYSRRVGEAPTEGGNCGGASGARVTACRPAAIAR